MARHTVPRILLLVNSDPKGTGVGELFLCDLARHYPAGRLIRFSTIQHPTDGQEARWLGFPSITHRAALSALPLLSTWQDWQFRHAHLERIAADLSRVIAEYQIELVWSVLSSGPTIYLTRHIQQRESVPVVSTVLDAPEYLLGNLRMDPFTGRQMLRAYADVLRGSARMSVICRLMQEIYARRFGVQGIIMRHGIHPNYWFEAESTPTDDFIIMFAGSLYAKQEWQALLRAIRSVDGRLDGRRIIVRFAGWAPKLFQADQAYVDCVGAVPFTECLQLCHQADVAYLPYWFDRRHAYAVKTSFPGKLSTYIAAGVPVLYHGPREASPTEFFREYPVGVCCHSLAAGELIGSLRQLATPKVRALASQARRAALQQELGLEVMLTRFAELLQVTREDLLPLTRQPDDKDTRDELITHPV